MKATIGMLSIVWMVTIIPIVPLQAQANKVLGKKITIQARHMRIDSLLQLFSKQTGAEFSFNSNKISSSKKVEVGQKEQTLLQWLKKLEQTIGVQYKLVGNHIVLIDNRSAPKKGSPRKPGPTGKAGTKKNSSAIVQTALHQSKGAAFSTQMPDNVIETKQMNNQDSGSHFSREQFTVQKNAETKKDSLTVQPSIVHQQEKPIFEKPVTPKKSGDIKEVNAYPEETRKPGEGIQVIIGYSKHGSGDMNGLIFGTDYTRYLSERFSVNVNLRGTINDGKEDIAFTNTLTGEKTEGTIRFTTAGVQLGVNGQWSLVRRNTNELLVSLGTFGRFQSASNGDDGYAAYNPQITDIPEVLISLGNRTPQRVLTIGGLLQLHYSFTLPNGIYPGVIGGFQTDSNGDAILQLAFTIGKHF